MPADWGGPRCAAEGLALISVARGAARHTAATGTAHPRGGFPPGHASARTIGTAAGKGEALLGTSFTGTRAAASGADAPQLIGSLAVY